MCVCECALVCDCVCVSVGHHRVRSIRICSSLFVSRRGRGRAGAWAGVGTLGGAQGRLGRRRQGRPSLLLVKWVRVRGTWVPRDGTAGARGPVKGTWTRGTSWSLDSAKFVASCVMDSSRAGRRVRVPGRGVGGQATCVVFAPQCQPAQKRGLGWLRVSGNPPNRILSETAAWPRLTHLVREPLVQQEEPQSLVSLESTWPRGTAS